MTIQFRAGSPVPMQYFSRPAASGVRFGKTDDTARGNDEDSFQSFFKRRDADTPRRIPRGVPGTANSGKPIWTAANDLPLSEAASRQLYEALAAVEKGPVTQLELSEYRGLMTRTQNLHRSADPEAQYNGVVKILQAYTRLTRNALAEKSAANEFQVDLITEGLEKSLEKITLTNADTAARLLFDADTQGLNVPDDVYRKLVNKAMGIPADEARMPRVTEPSANASPQAFENHQLYLERERFREAIVRRLAAPYEEYLLMVIGSMPPEAAAIERERILQTALQRREVINTRWADQKHTDTEHEQIFANLAAHLKSRFDPKI